MIIIPVSQVSDTTYVGCLVWFLTRSRCSVTGSYLLYVHRMVERFCDMMWKGSRREGSESLRLVIRFWKLLLTKKGNVAGGTGMG